MLYYWSVQMFLNFEVVYERKWEQLVFFAYDLKLSQKVTKMKYEESKIEF